jgi:hypothetical protein
MLNRVVGVTLAVLLFSVPAFAVSGFTDNFSTIDPAWVTDRYQPSGFASVANPDLANNPNPSMLQVTVSPTDYQGSGSFYDYQGCQRATSVTSPWVVSGQLYITPAMLGSSQWSTSLWARTGIPGNEDTAGYPIIGAKNLGSGAVWQVWNDNTGVWELQSTPVTTGWHTLSISDNGTSFAYRIDGQTVETDPMLTDAANPNLTTVFVEAYNFGGPAYSVRWDNISASSAPVPEPVTMVSAFLAIGGLGGYIRKRMKAPVAK